MSYSIHVALFVSIHWEYLSMTEFGSALNIETLVAAAERRETPLEVSYAKSVCQPCHIYVDSVAHMLKLQFGIWFHLYVMISCHYLSKNKNNFMSDYFPAAVIVIPSII